MSEREPVVPEPLGPLILDKNDPGYNFPEHIEATKRECRRADVVQVQALLRAGWSFELPASQDPEPMSWYWRRPPRRKGSKGRFFASTNQAYNALMRETSTDGP